MGQFAFSKSFNNLKDQKLHVATQMIRSGMSLTGPFSPVPWLIRLGFESPIVAIVRDLHKLLKWCSEQMDERVNVIDASEESSGADTNRVISASRRYLRCTPSYTGDR